MTTHQNISQPSTDTIWDSVGVEAVDGDYRELADRIHGLMLNGDDAEVGRIFREMSLAYIAKVEEAQPASVDQIKRNLEGLQENARLSLKRHSV